MKKMLTKSVAALAVALCSVGAFAAEGDITIDTTPVSKIATAVTTWAGAAVDILLPVLGAVLVYFLVRWAWKVIKSFMNQGR